jgi:tryptophan 2,3-dioxygenase
VAASASHDERGSEGTIGRYETYLQLERILDSQCPSDSLDAGSGEWASEHFFIVTHQVVELLFKQMIVDLDGAAEELASGYSACGARRLRRVTAVLDMTLRMFETLHEQLRRSEFHEFRSALGTASGAQSGQYKAIQERLGLRGQERSGLASVYERAVGALASPTSSSLNANRYLVAVMDELADAWERVWSAHLRMVTFFIGDAEGTGGTSGVRYLREAGPRRPFGRNQASPPRRSLAKAANFPVGRDQTTDPINQTDGSFEPSA